MRSAGSSACVSRNPGGLDMDPVTIVVAALAAGASAGLKDTVASAIKDSYIVLKRLVQQRFPEIDVSGVERMPASAAKQASLEEDLKASGAGVDTDDELIVAAQRLLTAVKNHDPGAGGAVGIDLERIEAAALRIKNVESTGTGVRVRDGKFDGDIEIGTVRAGTVDGGATAP